MCAQCTTGHPTCAERTQHWDHKDSPGCFLCPLESRRWHIDTWHKTHDSTSQDVSSALEGIQRMAHSLWLSMTIDQRCGNFPPHIRLSHGLSHDLEGKSHHCGSFRLSHSRNILPGEEGYWRPALFRAEYLTGLTQYVFFCLTLNINETFNFQANLLGQST